MFDNPDLGEIYVDALPQIDREGEDKPIPVEALLIVGNRSGKLKSKKKLHLFYFLFVKAIF